MIYSSDRKFKMWAYTVSHCSLLLRSELRYLDEEAYSESTSYNIDIEFWAVEHIDIPSSFHGIGIREIKENKVPESILMKPSSRGRKVFEIETEGEKYYIIAGGFLVGKNKWENEDRIHNYNLDLKHDEVIATT